MRKSIGLIAVVVALGLGATLDAEAKRLGGARSSGMQRQQTTQPATAPTTQPNTPGAAAPAAGTAAAAAPAAAAAAGKRSWMGPLAGLAAGIGLMALASHLGFGEAMANMMMIALLVMVALAVVGFIMRKRAAGAGPVPAWGGAGGGRPGASTGSPLAGGTRIGSALGGLPAARTQGGTIPADFDTVAFARNAKSQFLALQSANDDRDLARLRDYLTPEMFDIVSEELQARGDAPQRTEVFGLDAQVTDVAEEADRYIVSVRFTGSTRDQHRSVPEDLDEIWHLTKPRSGAGGWVVAGIQQAQ